MSAVRLGIGLPVSGSRATPANMVAIARRTELGYASLWTFQRLLTPAHSRRCHCGSASCPLRW